MKINDFDVKNLNFKHLNNLVILGAFAKFNND